MYMNIMPKGETEGLLAFVVPSAHRCTALNGVHSRRQDTRVSRGRWRSPKSTFGGLRMVEDCRALVKGCQCCQIFEGVAVKAPLCPIKAFAPLRVGSCGLHEHRNNNGIEPATERKECTGHYRPLHKILYSIRYQRPESQNCGANTVRTIHLGIWCTC